LRAAVRCGSNASCMTRQLAPTGMSSKSGQKTSSVGHHEGWA
jgi:recombination DNA repair RAD52 pathway protein